MNTKLAMHPNTPRTVTKITPAAWDELRVSFHRSILIDTPLASLAQNIEGCAWALDDAEEKPSAYVDLRHAEVLERLRSRGLSPARFDDLVEILKGTLEFDQSFGAMLPATRNETVEKLSDTMRRNLARLDIPSDFPLSLCSFAAGTRNFCREEGIKTLADFLIFARRASRAVIVGGEFRDLLNALSHVDEKTIARFLPFRPTSTGLHVVEALALVVRPLGLEERVLLARQGGVIPDALRARLEETRAYFEPQIAQLRSQHELGMPLSRLVVSLDDLSLESAVCALLRALLYPGTVSPIEAAALVETNSGSAPGFVSVAERAEVSSFNARSEKMNLAKRWMNSLWPWR